MKRGQLAGVLRRWCLDLNLGDADKFEKGVLHVLLQYIDDHGECFPSVERIARESSMSERKVQHVLGSLESRGHIEIARSRGRVSNHYRIVPDPARRAALISAYRVRSGSSEPRTSYGVE